MSLHELRRKANEAVARRWLASKHWGGWRVGMVDHQWRVCVLADDAFWFHCGLNHTAVVQPGSSWIGERIPDLDHPGTRAFLLEDVRKAWKDSVYWMSGPGGHHVIKCGYQWFNPGKRVGKGLTEAEALIAALEAAP